MKLNFVTGAIENDPYVTRVSIAQAAAGRTVIAPKAPGQVNKLVGFFLALDADGTFGFESGAGNAQAAVSTNMTGTHNDVTLTAVAAGIEGNDITLTLVDPGGATAALAVTVSGSAISVSLARAASAITTTGAQLIAALAANAAAAALVTAALKAANDGTGIVTALTATALTGGTDTSTDLSGDIPVLGKCPSGYKGSKQEPILKSVAGSGITLFTATGKAYGYALYYVEGS